MGFTGSAGPSTVINATNDTSATTHYPVFVASAGSNQTARVRTTSTALSYIPSTGKLTSTILGLSTNTDLITASATTTATTQTAIASWSTTTYGGGKVVVEAISGGNRHITELIVTHNGTVAIATEYGSLWTGSSLASYEVDISGGNVRILATPASATSTSFKVMQLLMLA